MTETYRIVADSDRHTETHDGRETSAASVLNRLSFLLSLSHSLLLFFYPGRIQPLAPQLHPV
jgi:hypothetical protein